MPRGIFRNYTCKTKRKNTFTPTEHQQDTLKAFLKSKYKGMLLYHKLGSGKTCSAIMIADKMIKKKRIKRVYILSPGSLRSGWVKEYCNVCGKDKDYLSNYYAFITYNYMVGRNLPDFNDSLVIIDEVHNLINGVKNNSFHPTAIYNALADSNCRILALSGTPIIYYVYEFALLGHLLKPGEEFPDIRRDNGELDEALFMKHFIIEEDGTLRPKNLTSLKRRLDGIISYYPGAGEEYVPEIIEMPPIEVIMTSGQEIKYWEQSVKEITLGTHPPDFKLKKTDPKKYILLQKLYIMAKKNILTRAASNFYYPIELDKLHGTLIEKMQYEFDEYDEENKQLPRVIVKDLPVSEGGWIRSKYFRDGALYKLYSTKIAALMINIIAHIKQKHVLFTFFKLKSGAYLIKSILGMCGIHAEIFSGDLDDKQRKKILAKFNSDENNYGDVIRMLIVTEAGAEGISVLNARHMHILESSPRMNKTIQAIGRVARYKSHINLPKEERNVKIWRYWSLARSEPITITTTVIDEKGEEMTVTKDITNKTTIDQILYKNGMKKVQEVNSFLNILKQVSVTKYNEKSKPLQIFKSKENVKKEK